MMNQGKKSFDSAFDALFDDDAEKQNLKIRSGLMIQLEQEISARNLTQHEAAELLGISQPRVSDLVKGKVDRFSIDMLVNLLAKIGRTVKIEAA